MTNVLVRVVVAFRFLDRLRSSVERLLLPPEVRTAVQVVDTLRSQLVDSITRFRMRLGDR